MSVFKDIVEAMLGIILAFLIYTLLSKISFKVNLLFNIFLITVIYFALKKGEVGGAVIGMLCGLIHDSFSIEVFGVAGISMTLTGFFTGYFSKKINIYAPLRMFLFIFFITVINLGIWAAMYFFVFSEDVFRGSGYIFFQPLATAVLGLIIIYALIRARVLM
ncbi:MAG: rod shape-determining protein MreD [Candidatus Aminicenantes bacterium]|nr:rod shape-determining protein MreD [Candidatus Aminicenantes bacterium]